LAAVRTWRYAPASLSRQFSVRVTFRIPDLPLHHLAPDVLLEQARSSDAETRAAAWREIQDRGQALLPVLISELAAQDAARRCTAVAGLRAMGADARKAGPRLLDLVNAGETETSCHPGEALFTIAPDEFDAAMDQALHAGDAARCRALLRGLDIHDPAPRVVLEALALDGCRAEAADALTFTTDTRAAPALVRALQASSGDGRAKTLETLGSLLSRGHRERLKPWVPQIVTAMITALADPESEIRQGAVLTLEQLGPDAAPAVEVLVHALRDTDSRVRLQAVRVLGSLGVLARAAGPALLALRRDPSPIEAQGGSMVEELDRAIEATRADRDEARLDAEDDIRAAIVQFGAALPISALGLDASEGLVGLSHHGDHVGREAPTDRPRGRRSRAARRCIRGRLRRRGGHHRLSPTRTKSELARRARRVPRADG
jgi:HEAT repeat protein